MNPHEKPTIAREEIHLAEDSVWRKLPMIFGVIGIGALAAGYALKEHSDHFFSSYLTAYMMFLALSLGGLFFVLVQHAARAGWSITSRRIAENMALTLPVMGLLMLPIVFVGSHDIYPWTHEDHVAADPILLQKQPYLNMAAFTGRAITYIVIWTILGVGYWWWSTRQDTASDPQGLSRRMRAVSGPALVLFALSLTFAAFDLVMSLDPHWFSTIFGVYFFAGSVISTHAFIAIIAIFMHRSGYLRGVITKEHFHDLGKMMFAFTVFWGYIGFSQYFLIWYASIPEETNWFSYRGHGDFLALSLLLVFGRFVIPFVCLMSRHVKRNAKTLMFFAVWVVFFEFIDMYWLVHPALAHHHGVTQIHIGFDDISTLLGIGGIWLAVFTFGLGRHALVPVKDPRLAESVTFENF